MPRTGELARWLQHDNQRVLFELLVGAAINLVALVVMTLVLWPLGQWSLVWAWTRGFIVLWLTLAGIFVGLAIVHQLLRLNLYQRPRAYIVSILICSCILQAGWSAYVALTLRAALPEVSLIIAIVLVVASLLISVVGYFVVAALFHGELYRLACLMLAPAAFVLFAVWPAAARAIFGWYFRLW